MTPTSTPRYKWGQQLFDPVFNALCKEEWAAVADERFSEGGKYQVDPAKATLLDLGLHGGGLGDTWSREPPAVESFRRRLLYLISGYSYKIY
jgi:hypothetical protein